MGRKKKPEAPAVIQEDGKEYLAGSFDVEAGSKGALVAHIMHTMDIAKHTDQTNIDSLLNGLQEYLALCAKTNINVTNTSMYAALGLSSDTVSNWASGKVRAADPRFREFALLLRRICAQYREVAASQGQLNPTLAIWWQKNYDGFQDAPIPQKADTSAMDQPVNPEEIAEKYKHLLTDDSGQRMEAERERRSTNMMPVDDDQEDK